MDPPEHPHTSPRPRRQSLRGASLRASAAFTDQLAPSPPTSPAPATSDADPFGEPFRSGKKDNVKVYGGKKGFRGGNASASRSAKPAIAPPAPTMHHTFTGTGRKRPLSETDALSSSDESSLTPPPSPIMSATPLLRSKSMKTLKKGASSQKGPEPTSAGPLRRHLRPQPARHAQSSPALAMSRTLEQTTPAQKATVIDSANGSLKTGNFVYVLIGVASKALEEEPKEEGEHAPQRMWWPGFVSRPVSSNTHTSYGSNVRIYIVETTANYTIPWCQFFRPH